MKSLSSLARIATVASAAAALSACDVSVEMKYYDKQPSSGQITMYGQTPTIEQPAAVIVPYQTSQSDLENTLTKISKETISAVAVDGKKYVKMSGADSVPTYGVTSGQLQNLQTFFCDYSASDANSLPRTIIDNMTQRTPTSFDVENCKAIRATYDANAASAQTINIGEQVVAVVRLLTP